MKKIRMLLALSLALALALGVPAVAQEEAPYPITILAPTFQTVDFTFADNPVLTALEELTGTKLDITWVPNATYTDILNVTIASGDMPMIVVNQGPQDTSIIQNCEAGAFWDLTDYIDQFEHLSQGSDIVYNNISKNGRVYGIYRARAMARAGIIYRSDWAAEAGYAQAPATIDELTDMMQKMTDAEQNRYALVMSKYVDSTIKIATIMFGAPNTWGVNEAGDIYPAHEDAAFREGLTWLRDLYAYGAINQDFMVLDSSAWVDPINLSNAGVKFDCMDDGYRRQEYFEVNYDTTDIIFNMILGVQSPDGTLRMWPQNTGASGELMITKAAQTEADMLRCLQFLDALNAPEGQAILAFGLDGVTYFTDEDGYMLSNSSEELAAIVTPIHGGVLQYESYVAQVQGSLNQLGMNVYGDFIPKAAQTPLRALYTNLSSNDNIQYIVSDPCLVYITETKKTMGTELATMLEDAHIQYIAGEIDEAGLEAAYAEWAGMGGTNLVSEMNALYHELNG